MVLRNIYLLKSGIHKIYAFCTLQVMTTWNLVLGMKVNITVIATPQINSTNSRSTIFKETVFKEHP